MQEFWVLSQSVYDPTHLYVILSALQDLCSVFWGPSVRRRLVLEPTGSRHINSFLYHTTSSISVFAFYRESMFHLTCLSDVRSLMLKGFPHWSSVRRAECCCDLFGCGLLLLQTQSTDISLKTHCSHRHAHWSGKNITKVSTHTRKSEDSWLAVNGQFAPDITARW